MQPTAQVNFVLPIENLTGSGAYSIIFKRALKFQALIGHYYDNFI
jgi:hypothetical protein